MDVSYQSSALGFKAHLPYEWDFYTQLQNECRGAEQTYSTALAKLVAEVQHVPITFLFLEWCWEIALTNTVGNSNFYLSLAVEARAKYQMVIRTEKK